MQFKTVKPPATFKIFWLNSLFGAFFFFWQVNIYLMERLNKDSQYKGNFKVEKTSWSADFSLWSFFFIVQVTSKLHPFKFPTISRRLSLPLFFSHWVFRRSYRRRISMFYFFLIFSLWMEQPCSLCGLLPIGITILWRILKALLLLKKSLFWLIIDCETQTHVSSWKSRRVLTVSLSKQTYGCQYLVK